jgi:hypothetical protein
MNKQEKEVFLKKNILMYAKKIRNIQKEQVDPYVELIETELGQLYPALIGRNDGLSDWTCDIMNAESNSEIMETLDRIEQILEEEYKEKWMCSICHESTYNVDSEYLAGINHLSCVLTEEIESLNKKGSFDNIKNELESLKIYTKQLEEQIQKLEGYYNEPTN